MPNTPMIRITQDPTDRDDSADGAGSAPAAAELPLTTASFDGGHARRLGDGAEVDPTSEWLLERLLELRVPELQHLPVEPKGIAGLLGLGDATNALNALLELDLSTLLDLVPTEIPTEVPQFEQSIRFASEIHIAATAKVLSLKPLGVVDDGSTTFVDSRQLDDVPNVPPIWFRPQIVTVMAANANFGPGGVGDTNAAANAVAENAANGAAVGLTTQASDPEGDTVTYSLSDDAGGRFAIDPNTGIVTVANASLLDFETNASHSITVVASSSGGTSSQSYTITVTDVAEPPVAIDDSVNTNEDAAVSGNVLSNDTGGAGSLTVSLGSGPVSGALTLNANGSFTYTPDVNFNGSDSFTYVVTDSLGATDTGVVTIAVAPLGTDIFGTSGADTIDGTAARENIYGLNGADVIHAGGGNDYVDGGIGKDDIYGEDGDDWLIGGNGTDQLYGGNGNDILDGSNGGNSIVFGEAGDDTLIWSAALKTADGGAGTDTLRADLGSVNLTSSSGGVASIEIIDLSRGSSASTVTLSAQDVLDISDTDVLKILGTSTDSVQAGTGWTDGGVADGVHTYTKDVSGSLATLIVDVDVTINPDILT